MITPLVIVLGSACRIEVPLDDGVDASPAIVDAKPTPDAAADAPPAQQPDAGQLDAMVGG